MQGICLRRCVLFFVQLVDLILFVSKCYEGDILFEELSVLFLINIAFGREVDDEISAFCHFTVDGNCASEVMHKISADGQAQTHT